ncbi:MAG: hypothetical protein JXM73_08995 [Anaerolineae bacterium]|nr:hypothetical protein [Anaerolineae bacterium]
MMVLDLGGARVAQLAPGADAAVRQVCPRRRHCRVWRAGVRLRQPGLIVPARDVMPIALANVQRLAKFGV